MVVVCQVKPDECSVCRAVNLPKFQTKESCVGSINLKENITENLELTKVNNVC